MRNKANVQTLTCSARDCLPTGPEKGDFIERAKKDRPKGQLRIAFLKYLPKIIDKEILERVTENAMQTWPFGLSFFTSSFLSRKSIGMNR